MFRPFLRSVRTAASLVAGAALALAANAADFDVRAYGAKGDGKSIDTDAINRAIDAAAAAGGGRVVFSAGDYLSYTVRLKSHVTLQLDPGSTLIGAEPAKDGSAGYDAPEPNPFGKFQDFGHSHWRNSLIWGEGLTDIGITGSGRIYGRGLRRGDERRREDPAAKAPTGVAVAPDVLPLGIGNKAIALKNCRNVVLRDFTIQHGGHFGILATGTDNMTIDNLVMDTNRDGIDVDACRNVRISNCVINSPNDDGICLKSSYALGVIRACENITIINCQVSGYDEGTLLDGTRTRKKDHGERGATGRIKLGTESNGGFKNIAISNCTFDYCRGLAIEEVDGGALEDVVVDNLVMRDIVNAPIFIRLGDRARGPDKPPVSGLRRVTISNVVASNVAPEHGVLILGLRDYPLEDISLNNILIEYKGGGTAEQSRREVPELEKSYPDPKTFGTIPAYGMFIRHARGVRIDGIDLRYKTPEQRPAAALVNVHRVDLSRVRLQAPSSGPRFALKEVEALSSLRVDGLADVSTTAVDR